MLLVDVAADLSRRKVSEDVDGLQNTPPRKNTLSSYNLYAKGEDLICIAKRVNKLFLMTSLRWIFPSGRANLWFMVLWLLFLLDLADRSAVSSVLPLLKKQFGLTDAQSGLVSSILGLSLGLLVLPTAILADKWSRRKIVSIMAATWSLATYFMGMAVGYKTLLLPPAWA